MKSFPNLLIWFIILLMPVFLIMTSVRIMISPWFPSFEYNRPGFPADPYGFSTPERLQYAQLSIDYLLNDAGPDFLSEVTLDDGSSLYNEREMSHMVDVKILVQQMLRVWALIGGILVALGIIAWLKQLFSDYLLALSSGGWLTLAVVFLILVGVAASFNALFTAFHRVFFQGDTWLFRYSDSLIRLFPMQFWQDAFIGMGLFTITAALLFAFGGRWLSAKPFH